MGGLHHGHHHPPIIPMLAPSQLKTRGLGNTAEETKRQIQAIWSANRVSYRHPTAREAVKLRKTGRFLDSALWQSVLPNPLVVVRARCEPVSALNSLFKSAKNREFYQIAEAKTFSDLIILIIYKDLPSISLRSGTANIRLGAANFMLVALIVRDIDCR